MEQPQTPNNAAGGLSAVDRRVICLAEAEKHLRDEADFNRSWADGRRGAGTTCCTEEYKARRLDLARQREEWADVIKYAITALADNGQLHGPRPQAEGPCGSES